MSLRLVVVVVLAFAISLPIAALSIAKALLFVAALIVLIRENFKVQPKENHTSSLSLKWILASLALWTISLLWTKATIDDALVALVKHGKLMCIPLLVFLIRSHREAAIGLAALASGQAVVMVTSWLMAANIPVFWITRPSGPADPLTQYVPYADSYLDQSIMLAVSAGIFWQLRESQPKLKPVTLLLTLAALLNVLILMPGRTGYVLALSTACLAAIFSVPRKLRVVTILVMPVLLALAAYHTVPQFKQRVQLAAQELVHHRSGPDVGSSIGARLYMWKLSADAIAKAPLLGSGVGSWSTVIKQLHGAGASLIFGEGNGSNPHQEILLWTTELGLAGLLLFVGLLTALLIDLRRFPT
ncbi:MAG: hypothetical protein CFE44_11065, partial [Burkholderiales bacterium PBB4]